MLKFLRKYNNWILVVGGSLLMIAFLLPTTFDQMRSARSVVTVLKINGEKISQSAYERAGREDYALRELTFKVLPFIGGPDNTDHWVMLTHEAQLAGLVGGERDGQESLPQLALEIARATSQFGDPTKVAEDAKVIEQNMLRMIPQVCSASGLSERDVYLALAKLRGVQRLRMEYALVPRFSDKRLSQGIRRYADSAILDYVMVPADREMAGVPEPTEEQLQAHFDKYKGETAGSGEFGIGYRLPDRFKIEWLQLDRAAMAKSVTPDPIDVQKRFLKANPGGTLPAGQTKEQALAAVEKAVRDELTDKLMKTADQTIRGEIERSVRRLEPAGAYRVLPADWDSVRPDFVKIRETVRQRVKEIDKADIEAPKVWKKDADWVKRNELAALEGVGRSSMRRGNRAINFGQLVAAVKEVAGENDSGMQVGVPGEVLTDALGNKYYFVVLDARKESAPESLAEVREQAVKDVKKLAAYERLVAQQDAYRSRAVAEGLEALVQAETPEPPPAADPAAPTPPAVPPVVKVNKDVRVNTVSFVPFDMQASTEEIRTAVVEAARGMDPLKENGGLEPEQRTVVKAAPKAFAIFVGQVKRIEPLTLDNFRTSQNGYLLRLIREEMQIPKEDPFTLAALEKKLNVEYVRRADDENAAPKPAPANKG